MAVEADTGLPEEIEPERGHACPADWPAPIRALTQLSRGLALIEGAGIIFCLLAVIFLSTWQFVERNLVQRHVPFFHSPPWGDGVIRHSVFLLGFFGGAYATFTARHIRIDAVTRVLGVKARLALRPVLEKDPVVYTHEFRAKIEKLLADFRAGKK